MDNTPNEHDYSVSFAGVFTPEAEITPHPRGIFLETEGSVALVMQGDGNTLTFDNLTPGLWHPIQFTSIISAPAGTKWGR